MIETELQDDMVVARYTTLERLTEMLESGTAYLPSIFNLQNLNGNSGDNEEGRYSPIELMCMSPFAAQFDLMMNGRGLSPEERSKAHDDIFRRTIVTPFGEVPVAEYPDCLETIPSWVFCWCWSDFQRESMAMWRGYTAGTGRLIIKSTVGRLKKSLYITPDERAVLDRVNYVEYDPDFQSRDKGYRLYLRKNREYESENEVRLLVYQGDADFRKINVRQERFLKINPRELISEVVFHPESSEEEVRDISTITTRYLGMKPTPSVIRTRRESLAAARRMLGSS